jgi:Stage II sporulation protein E (SpoIIE)
VKKPPSKFALAMERLGERLGKSSRVFVGVLLILCGIEVAVDWNSTLYEINVLRAALKQKGENYADLVRKAAEQPLLAYDWDELDRLSRGLFDDDDVVYVRFSDVLGNTLYDRLLPSYGRAFERRHATGFRVFYRRPMDRDARGLLADAAVLKAKMERSRHRDFIQAFNDTMARVVAWFSKPEPAAHDELPRVLYQDRLVDEKGERNQELSYALGAITNEQGEGFGVVLVAFKHDRLNRATVGKLLKGLAITVFFVGLILVQNFFSRKAKLRLLGLEAALSAARAAVRGALPAAPEREPGGREVGLAFAQAERVGGTIYDVRRVGDELELVVAVPEGAGVDAAFASVVLRDLYRRTAPESGAPEDVVRALMDAYDRAPLGRAVELLVVRFAPSGRAYGLAAGLRAPSVLEGGVAREAPLGAPIDVGAQRLAAPLRPFSIERAGAIAIFDDGMPPGAPRRYTPDEALARVAVAAGAARRTAQDVADDAVDHAVKQWRKKQSDDFFAFLAVEPSPHSARPTSAPAPPPTTTARS